MGKNRSAIIIDEQTGEIVDEIHPGDRILRKESVEYLEHYQVWHLENYYKGHAPELKKIMPELNAYERAFLFTIVLKTMFKNYRIRVLGGMQWKNVK